MHRFKLAAGAVLCAALLAPGVAQAKTTLVEVESSDRAVVNRLEALGLDVTYESTSRTEVMLHGSEEAQILADTGYPTRVLDEDIDGDNDARLAREAAAQKRVNKGVAPLSGLPTGRVSYRTLPEINAELQQLADAYPDKVKLFALDQTSLLGKPIYGVIVSHDAGVNTGKPTFLLTGAHHAREWPTPEFTLEFVWDLLLNDGTDPDATNLL
ncbi:MAG TPA: M14 family zinc carboxypeptidase, partial [Solirubrobacter sp.]|nr:M14 family zinc carboxypeptidase [Solirubrobacter sp.]